MVAFQAEVARRDAKPVRFLLDATRFGFSPKALMRSTSQNVLRWPAIAMLTTRNPRYPRDTPTAHTPFEDLNTRSTLGDRNTAVLPLSNQMVQVSRVHREYTEGRRERWTHDAHNDLVQCSFGLALRVRVALQHQQKRFLGIATPASRERSQDHTRDQGLASAKPSARRPHMQPAYRRQNTDVHALAERVGTTKSEPRIFHHNSQSRRHTLSFFPQFNRSRPRSAIADNRSAYREAHATSNTQPIPIRPHCHHPQEPHDESLFPCRRSSDPSNPLDR